MFTLRFPKEKKMKLSNKQKYIIEQLKDGYILYFDWVSHKYSIQKKGQEFLFERVDRRTAEKLIYESDLLLKIQYSGNFQDGYTLK